MITADLMDRVGPVAGRAGLSLLAARPLREIGAPVPGRVTADPQPAPRRVRRACPPRGSTGRTLAPSPVLREALITRKRRVQGSGPSPAGSSPRAPRGVMRLGPTLYVGTDRLPMVELCHAAPTRFESTGVLASR